MLSLLSSPIVYFFFPLFLDAVLHRPEPSFDVLWCPELASSMPFYSGKSRYNRCWLIVTRCKDEKDNLRLMIGKSRR